MPEGTTGYVHSGAYPEFASRRRLFDAMLQQGLDASPIRHWTQGLGRLTQAIVGGYGGYRADQDEREQHRRTGRELADALFGAEPVADWRTTVETPGGTPQPVTPPAPLASAPVGDYPGVRPGTPFTDRWHAFLDDLRRSGVAVDPTQSGGYNPRNIRGTNTPSLHASDQAYDVNWLANPEGGAPLPVASDTRTFDPATIAADAAGDRPGQTRIPAELARALARAHGMRWGGDFTGRSPDPMHFEIAGGVPMAQRSITARAGLVPSTPTASTPPVAVPPPQSEGMLPFPLPPVQPAEAPVAGSPPANVLPVPTLGQEASVPTPLTPMPSVTGRPPPPVAPSLARPVGKMPGPSPAPAPPAAGPQAPSALPAAAPAAAPIPGRDVLRRLFNSGNPAAVNFGLQLYRDMLRAGGTGAFDFHFHEGNVYRSNNRTGQIEHIAGAGQGKPPSGYRWAGPGQLEPIPGGPGEHIAGEQAGRLAIMQTARGHLQQARNYFLRPGFGPGAGVAHAIGGARMAPQYNMARRTVQLAVEGALRAATGAAAPAEEVQRYTDFFTPGAFDPVEVRRQKMDMLAEFLRNNEEIAMRGRRPAAAGPPPGGRLRFNPETGQIE